MRGHDWALSPAQARALQSELAPRVELCDRLGPVRLVAGVDVGFEDGGAVTRAAVVVLDAADGWRQRAHGLARLPTRFPYVPGLLSFRELPAVQAAFDALPVTPDLCLCDGQGIAHPRRFGIACHLGYLYDLPTIGVGKSRLVGRHDEPGPARGDAVPLIDRGAVVGAVLRTRARVKPVYVSPGHRLSVDGAVRWVVQALTRYRLPEPIRAAHGLASRA